MVMALFEDFSEWMVHLFDNVLVLCKSFTDGLQKLRKLIQRCREWFVVLKIAKFLGYKVTSEKYELAEDRKTTIKEAEMPKTR